MMGDSPHTSRNALLQQKATGVTPEVTPAQQKRFDDGHAAEAASRPLAEAMLMDDLTPKTGRLAVDGLPLLASLDGITDSGKITWENKMINQSLVQAVLAGDLEPHYYWQLEQQLLVFGAEKAYFTTSNGDPANTHGTWYTSVPERRAQLIAGWKQFEKDVCAYQHVEVAPAPVAKSVERLPALVVNLVGAVTSSNLSAYKAAAIEVISSINTELTTDQHFADAESHIKFCDAGERELELVKSQALSQTATIDELFRTIDDLKEHLRAKRLTLEKLVKTRKESIRLEIVAAAKAKWAEHITSLGSRIGRAGWINCAQPDFATAIKGKKNITSLHEACDTLLAKSKIDANALADKIDANLRHLSDINAPMFLFSDLQTLATQDAEYFASVVKARITKHAEDEAAKLEAQREAIRKEEAAKIQAKLDADAKREADRLAELARVAREAEQAVQQTCAVEVIDADGVITKVNTTGAEIEARIAQSPLNAPSPLRTFATAGRPRAATRALVDVVLDTLSESELHRVLTFLQANFAKRAA